jgi:hypothetical protein
MHLVEAEYRRKAMSEQGDRRRYFRRPTSLGAQVVLGRGFPALSCIVQDLSAGGAGLAFAEPVELPSTFVLAVLNLDLTVAAQLVWSHDERHGVAFVWPQHQE